MSSQKQRMILDVVEVTIGAGTQIGLAVQIYAADHPREPQTRRAGVPAGATVKGNPARGIL